MNQFIEGPAEPVLKGQESWAVCTKLGLNPIKQSLLGCILATPQGRSDAGALATPVHSWHYGAMAGSERSLLLREIKTHHPPLAERLRDARLRTLRAVAHSARHLSATLPRKAAAHAFDHLRQAWSRPPPRAVLHHAPRGRTSAAPGPAAASVHFSIGQCHRGDLAAAHQHYIEREGACAAHFGTIDERFEERCRLWRAIDARGVRKRGHVRIGDDAPLAVREAALRRLPAFIAEQRIGRRTARKAAEHAPGAGTQFALKLYTRDPDDHDALLDSLRDEAGRLPRGVRGYAPRRTVVQRRLILELAHELPETRRIASLREWCAQALAGGGIAYHAVIHRPERNNDPRNWHAHVVFAPIAVERARDAQGRDLGRFTFESADRLPTAPDPIRILGRNHPEIRSEELLRDWRTLHAAIQNRHLEAIGAAKRYDPRSYRDQGLATIPGQHLGPARAAIERQGGAATAWSPRAPQWPELHRQLRRRLNGAPRHELDAHLDHLDRIRLQCGLALQGAGPGTPAYEGLRAHLDLEATPDLRETERLDAALDSILDRLHPQWAIEWAEAESQTPDQLARGATAERLAQRNGGAHQLIALAAGATDPALLDTARAIAAEADRFETLAAPWRDRWRATETQGESDPQAADEAAHTLAEALREAGLPGAAFLGRDAAAALRRRTLRHRHRARALNELPAALQTLAWSRDPEQAQRIAHAIERRHRRYLDHDHPEEGRRIRSLAKTAARTAGIRAALRRAYDKGPGTLKRTCDGLLRSRDRTTAQALRLLRPNERAWIEVGARNGDQARAEAHRIERARAETLRTLYGTSAGHSPSRPQRNARLPPERIEAAIGNHALMRILEQGAPDTLAEVRAHAQTLEQRRVRLAGAVDAHTRRFAGTAEAAPDACVDLACIDPGLLGHDHPELASALVPGIARWTQGLRARLERIAEEVPDEARRERRIAGLAHRAQIRLLLTHDPALAKTLLLARRRARQRTEALRREAAAIARSLTRPRTTHESTAAYRHLTEHLTDPGWLSHQTPAMIERLRSIAHRHETRLAAAPRRSERDGPQR